MTQKTKQEMTGDVNSASQRHWLFGFNVFALVIVGIAVLAIVLWTCNSPWMREHTRWDWSSNGANSLSSSTVKMLQQIDKKGQDYTLISLFTPPTDEDKEQNTSAAQSERRQQVNDLLGEYAKNSSHVKV